MTSRDSGREMELRPVRTAGAMRRFLLVLVAVFVLGGAPALAGHVHGVPGQTVYHGLGDGANDNYYVHR